MNWNPLSTLAGRLMLIAIVAVALSHIVAFAIFANERGAAFRREAESNVADRIVVTFERLRGLDAAAQREAADNFSDFSTRFTIVDAPLANAGGGAGRRIARTVARDLNGAETRARTRMVDIEVPRRWRVARRWNTERRERGESGEREDHGPPPKFDRPVAPRDAISRRLTEVTLDSALGGGAWLRTRALLPSPRPAPAHLWVTAFVSMLLVGAGAILVARQVGRPLSDLAHAADRLGAGETGVEAPVSGPEDVRRASTAFNAMAARLGRQMQRQRQMLWALSHDLRTPITALRLRAELIEDEAARERLLAPLHDIETLSEQALSLARAGASEEARVDIDLSEIARTLCAELEELGINVRADAPAPVRAHVRPNEIARAMRNLAENAARHGQGGTMRVFRADNGEAIIEVADQGPGVAPDMLARIAEPFFRADAARSDEDGDGQKGAGLGLAIAQAIADGHGGRLLLENRIPRGLSARIILPG